MSEELDEIVDNLREPNSWIRVLFMIAFAVVLYLIIAPVILVIMIAQALFSLIAGEANSNLKDFSGALAQYIYQILKFLLYGSEDKPFPFSDFPSVGDDDGNDESGSSKTATKKTAAKKSPAKKAAKKKSTPKKPKTDNTTNGTGGDKDT
ncbi:MAG: DUF4389 domain-containing protein [Pseudomonadales bacterium]|nr:DUF4389 domain-containing protein [Pseudomonadales bacterium]